ncbi:hypothetical protein AGMMS50289_14460 [Betaproteobacteria bacterium]|nr:hypothetical protein AGMMS50289_14460 [Betaproteobacteria bacterium]
MFGFLNFGKDKGRASGGTSASAATVEKPAFSSPLKIARENRIAAREAQTPETSALNRQIVEAVQFSNAETAAHANEQIAVPPDMMIGQASGLLAQSAANYFDGVSKLALASKAVLLKQMTENIAKQNIVQAGEDALGALVTDLLLGSAAAVAAASGAMEAESASFAIEKINHSIESYSDLLGNKNKA